MQDILLAKHDSLAWARHESIDRARHKTDFEVLNVLGQGAFGTAYKVKNRVDSRIYALKSVRIDRSGIAFGSSDDFAKVLREVEVLSSLNSDYVVRYYAAWVEKGDNTLKKEKHGDEEYSSWSLEEERTRTSSIDHTVSSSQFALLDPNVDPTCHLCQSTYKDWEVSFEHWGLINAVLQPLDLCTSCYWKSVPPQQGVDASKITIRQKKILPEYLFILMGFCEYTLSEAVAAACQDDTIKWSYFAQCVQGLAYLHSKGVIHRDVKPNNIFVHEGVVKIGDMGLATQSPRTAAGEMVLLAPSSSNNNDDDDDYSTTSKSSQVGTFLYTAPEVATGQYNEKCDVYSLGVVLVEMFSKFNTGMERVEVLGKLLRSYENKDDWLPEEWVLAHPIQARLAKQMVSVDPSARPTCHQVLGELLGEGLWVEHQPNQHHHHHPMLSSMTSLLVTDLQAQIVELQSESRANDKTISQLRELLEDNRIGHDHIP
jgi:translation initiation factor 2-alpha kinase 4